MGVSKNEINFFLVISTWMDKIKSQTQAMYWAYGLTDIMILAWNQGLWGSEIQGACLICNFYIHAPLNFQLCTFFNQISNFTLCYCYPWPRTLPKVCPTLSTWLWQYLPFSLAQGNCRHQNFKMNSQPSDCSW